MKRRSPLYFRFGNHFLVFVTMLFIAIKVHGQTNYTVEYTWLKFDQWLNHGENEPYLGDKPIVLEFWASHCIPCLKMQPKINELAKEFHKRIQFISVNSYDSAEKVKSILDTIDFYPPIALDKENTISDSLQIYMIPSAILIDTEGIVRWRGASTELTKEILNSFLLNDSITSEKQAYYMDKEPFTFRNPENDKTKYTLSMKKSDRTQARSLSYNFEQGLFISLKNNDLVNIIENLFNFMGMYQKVQVIGSPPKDVYLDFSIRSENDTWREEIIKDCLKNLASHFSFKIEYSKKQNNEEFNVIRFL